ncbi:MAG TPA: hypothetical protein VGN63_02385 [Flavisolibacter sp.]|jgi:hypothetical protein|nr:hypothetical protein [Flavisolibacter sp.]
MTRLLAFFVCLIILAGCKAKKNKAEIPAEQFFPVTDYIKGELAKLDTSLATFYKIETVNGINDTVPIRNSDVKRYARDFATLPDISSDELRNDYQITHEYDDMLNAFVFMFTTNEDHPVKREDVVLDPAPNAQGKNDIQSIFVELWQNNGDTLVRKNMLWEAGKNFQITTVSEAGGTQQTKKLQVVWNGFEGQNL